MNFFYLFLISIFFFIFGYSVAAVKYMVKMSLLMKEKYNILYRYNNFLNNVQEIISLETK